MQTDFKKISREIPYWNMVFERLNDEMCNTFYLTHKSHLDKLGFLIGSHQQDTEISNGHDAKSSK